MVAGTLSNDVHIPVFTWKRVAGTLSNCECGHQHNCVCMRYLL